jgi:hypothetical protein
MRMLWIGLVAAVALAGEAQAAGTKTVKDWLGVCANTGACVAFGFQAGDDGAGAYLMIQRAAGAAAPVQVTLVNDAGDTQPAADWTLTLDGHPIAGLGPVHAAGSEAGARARLAARPAAALIAALRNGQSLEFSAGGSEVGQISLAGSAAILLWIDDQQGRVGTVTALARPGAKLASAVPPPTGAPLILAAPPVGQNGVPDHAPKGMTKGIDDCDPQTGTPDDVVARLAPGVMLWGPQCEAGAYNAVSVFFIGDEHGKGLRRISFPEPAGAAQAGEELLFNPGFDPKTQTLTTFSKARGIGDCGEAASWVWNGSSFQVILDHVMPACRGVPPDDWPALFVSRQK